MRIPFIFILLISFVVGCGNQSGSTQHPVVNQSQENVTAPAVEDNQKPLQSSSTISLFDGESIEGWQVTNFGGEGQCYVEDGTLVIETGDPMSGVNSLRDDLPKVDYELSLSAKRINGIDFFCGLTFPVKDSHCSLIVGGWAGAIVGLSNIDGKDASDNETKKVMKFETNQWYRIKVRVTNDNISAWIDDEQVANLDTKGRKIDLRAETLACRPVGISTFQTTAAYKDINIKLLKKQ